LDLSQVPKGEGPGAPSFGGRVQVVRPGLVLPACCRFPLASLGKAFDLLRFGRLETGCELSVLRSHPSDKNKDVARMGHPKCCCWVGKNNCRSPSATLMAGFRLTTPNLHPKEQERSLGTPENVWGPFAQDDSFGREGLDLSQVPKSEGPGAPSFCERTQVVVPGLGPPAGGGFCAVPTGLGVLVWMAFPTLKRGANLRCVYGAGIACGGVLAGVRVYLPDRLGP
jgi:hypothetical protein